ncbi:hypothetical protein BKA64DRAFT_641827 [Cadophora sp. MPI-SDFR-AT-0126]|nr:hypothetical protein BKA64DRAFT_641827 [Leotiomycetes sp. MPI-SDFR-AT-0126]
MDSGDEDRQQAAEEQLMICLMLYCFSFLLSWLELSHYMSRPAGAPQQDIDALQPLLLPRHNSRQNSQDSGYTSQYGATSTPDTRLKHSNGELFCQLCTLKEQDKVLKSELAKLEPKAKESYSKHSNAIQFLCDHDAHKSAACRVISDEFGDAHRAWVAADQERTAKRKELLAHQQKIRDLREEMEVHFWEMV